jgi:hypothetical protein
MGSGVIRANMPGAMILEPSGVVSARRPAQACFLEILLGSHDTAWAQLLSLARESPEGQADGELERKIREWAAGLNLLQSVEGLAIDEMWIFHFAMHAIRLLAHAPTLLPPACIAAWAISEANGQRQVRGAIFRASEVSIDGAPRSGAPSADPAEETLAEYMHRCEAHYRQRKAVLEAEDYRPGLQFQNLRRDAEWLYESRVLGRSPGQIAKGYPASISEKAVYDGIRKISKLIFC